MSYTRNLNLHHLIFFAHLGAVQQAVNTAWLYKVDIANLLANSGLLMHINMCVFFPQEKYKFNIQFAFHQPLRETSGTIAAKSSAVLTS